VGDLRAIVSRIVKSPYYQATPQANTPAAMAAGLPHPHSRQAAPSPPVPTMPHSSGAGSGSGASAAPAAVGPAGAPQQHARQAGSDSNSCAATHPQAPPLTPPQASAGVLPMAASGALPTAAPAASGGAGLFAGVVASSAGTSTKLAGGGSGSHVTAAAPYVPPHVQRQQQQLRHEQQQQLHRAGVGHGVGNSLDPAALPMLQPTAALAAATGAASSVAGPGSRGSSLASSGDAVVPQPPFAPAPHFAGGAATTAPGIIRPPAPTGGGGGGVTADPVMTFNPTPGIVAAGLLAVGSPARGGGFSAGLVPPPLPTASAVGRDGAAAVAKLAATQQQAGGYSALIGTSLGPRDEASGTALPAALASTGAMISRDVVAKKGAAVDQGLPSAEPPSGNGNGMADPPALGDGAVNASATMGSGAGFDDFGAAFEVTNGGHATPPAAAAARGATAVHPLSALLLGGAGGLAAVAGRTGAKAAALHNTASPASSVGSVPAASPTIIPGVFVLSESGLPMELVAAAPPSAAPVALDGHANLATAVAGGGKPSSVGTHATLAAANGKGGAAVRDGSGVGGRKPQGASVPRSAQASVGTGASKPPTSTAPPVMPAVVPTSRRGWEKLPRQQ
jgi:hypothetical protein